MMGKQRFVIRTMYRGSLRWRHRIAASSRSIRLRGRIAVVVGDVVRMRRGNVRRLRASIRLRRRVVAFGGTWRLHGGVQRIGGVRAAFPYRCRCGSVGRHDSRPTGTVLAKSTYYTLQGIFGYLSHSVLLEGKSVNSDCRRKGSRSQLAKGRSPKELWNGCPRVRDSCSIISRP